MKQTILVIGIVLMVLSMGSGRALAHCQIPCGIYDDPARFVEMEEHLKTIEKSMKFIDALAEELEPPNVNQMVRWVQNKEDHVSAFTEIVTYYFMAQRIKPADPSDKAGMKKYVEQVTMLHQMVFYGMKARQTTDLAHVEKLRSLVREFKASYMGH